MVKKTKPEAGKKPHPKASGKAASSKAKGGKPSTVQKAAGKTLPPNAGKGRTKGVPNKTTAALKDAILNAFQKVGGVSYLEKVARTDPKTFCILLGKVLPLTVTSDPDAPIKVEVSWQE